MSDTRRTDSDSRPYPSPEHAQRIVFEGCQCVVMAPEDYEALYEHARQLERELQEAQATQNWKLREEFTALLGTSDVRDGVHIVRTIKSTLDMLCDAGAALRNFTPDEVSRAKNWDRLEKKARELA